MRSNATLYTNMRLSTFKPYVAAGYYTSGRPSDGGGTWSDLTGYIRNFDYQWEPYGIRLDIELNNHEGHFDALSLLGKWLRVGLGASPVGAPSTEVSYPPYVKVWSQGFNSTAAPYASDRCLLVCYGGWSLLQKWISKDVYTFNQSAINPTLADKTIKEIVDWICAQAGLDLGSDIGTLDGKVDTWHPTFDIQEGENGQEAVKNVLDICKCVLVARDDNMHLKYPAAGDGVDYAYQSNATHYFLNGFKQSEFFTPMKVTVSVPTGYSGSAQASGYESWMGEETYLQTMGVCASNADCQFMAEAILARAEGQSDQGEFFMLTPNCLHELYDKVNVTDNRGNTSVSGGRVGGLYWKYKPAETKDDNPEYSLTMRLGGLQRALATDLGTLANDLKIIGDNYTNSKDKPAEYFDYTFSIVFSPVDYNTAQWTAGYIKFANGESFPINAGNTGDITQKTYIYWNRASADLFMTTDLSVLYASVGNVFLALVIPNADTTKMCIISVHFSRAPIWQDDGVAPAAPTGVTATGQVGGCRVIWNANTEPDIAYYEVYRNTVDSFPGGSPIWTGNALSMLDRDCSAGGTYYYWVKAVDLTGNKSSASSSTHADAGYTPIPDDSLNSRLFHHGLKPWTTTLEFLPKVGAAHDSVQWAAGVVKWNDGVDPDQSISSGSFNTINAGVIHYIYFTYGSATLSITENMDVAMGDENGLVAQVYVSALADEATADIGIQPFYAKGQNILAEFICCKKLSTLSADVGVLNAGEVIVSGTLTIHTAASGARLEITSNLTGYDATQARYQLKSDGTFWMGGTSGAPKLSWNGTVLAVEGAITITSGSGISNLSDADLDHIDDGTNRNAVTDNEKTGAGRGYNGLTSDYYVANVVRGDKLGGGTAATGLNMRSDVMGYYNGSVWSVRIESDGHFYFGDPGGDYYIYWDGSTLDIRGKVIIKQAGSEVSSGYTLTVNGGVKVKGDAGTARLSFYTSGDAYRGYIVGGSDGMSIIACDAGDIALAPDDVAYQANIQMWLGDIGHTQYIYPQPYGGHACIGHPSYPFLYQYVIGSLTYVDSGGGSWTVSDYDTGKHLLGFIGGVDYFAHNFEWKWNSTSYDMEVNDAGIGTNYFGYWMSGA